MKATGFFSAVAIGPDGKEKWCEDFCNTVTTLGKNLLIDKALSGSSYTATFRAGLKGTGTALAADTMASHSNWSELTIIASRPSVTMGAASAGSSTSSTITFSINSGTNTVVYGIFLVANGSATVSDTTGTLYAAGDFRPPKPLVTGTL
jgi:hypothetical protein